MNRGSERRSPPSGEADPRTEDPDEGVLAHVNMFRTFILFFEKNANCVKIFIKKFMKRYIYICMLQYVFVAHLLNTFFYF